MLIVLIAVLLISACGSNSGGNSGSNSGTSAGGNAADENTGKEMVRLEMTAWGDPQVAGVYKEVIANFNTKYAGRIQADIQIIPNSDYDTKLTTIIAGNETPDIAQMESATLAFPLAEEGKFLDLRPFIENDPDLNIEDLAPLHGYYSDNGELFGLNSERETFMLFYNVDMFEEAGLPMPPVSPSDAWTWDEFVDVAKSLTIDQNGNNAHSPNFDPQRIKQYGVDFGKWWGLWGNFIYSNEGDFVSEDGTQFALTEPEATEALQKLADLINVHHVAPSPTQSKSLPGGVNSLKTKKVAMLMDGNWMNLQFGNSGMNYNVAPLPKLKKPVTMVVSGMFTIFKDTEHPEEAWELLKSFVNTESVFELVRTGNWLPSMRDWYTEPELLERWTNNEYHPSGYEGVLETMLNHSVPTPTAYVKNFNRMMELVTPALDKVWLDEQTAEEAMKSIADEVAKVGIGRRDVKM
jgi:multiple sugar transport system substrate-binding protein